MQMSSVLPSQPSRGRPLMCSPCIGGKGGGVVSREVNGTPFGSIKPCGDEDELWQQCTGDALTQMD